MADGDDTASPAENLPSGEPDGSSTAAPPSTGSSSTESPSPDPSRDDAELDDGEAEQRRGHQVFNHILGDLHAQQMIFGVSQERSTRPTTGKLGGDDVEKTLRYYTPPAAGGAGESPYRAAARILAERRMVVLVGAESIGRRAGALALLREHADQRQPLTSLSPTTSLTQLAEYTFGDGRGYVLLDRIRESHASAAQRFEVGRLTAKLDRAGAYLVVTADRHSADRRSLEGLVVDWYRPDPRTLFETCLDRMAPLAIAPTDLERVRERVQDLQSPRDVVALAEQLAKGVDAALDGFDDSQRARVAEWFKATADASGLLLVSALAFADGLPERRFEELHARLIEIGAVDGAQRLSPPSADDAPLQARLSLGDGAGLITRRSDSGLDGESFGVERRVVFKSPAMRGYVLAELHECDYTLWKPLRTWIHELAAMPSIDVRLQLALGVALLARIPTAALEVEEYLETWSGGASAERFTAAYALMWMAGDDALAPAALRIALRWTSNAGTERALTSAIALGGPPGMRYPSEAVAWLWHLSGRSARIRAVAARSLALLLCATDGDADSATRLLKRLLVRVQRTLGEHHELRREQAALDTVLTVLSVQHLERQEPMVAAVLHECPAAAAPIGALWAEVLRSAPHRSTAIDALRRTLEALTGDDAAIRTVHALGEAVRDELSSEERRLLRRDLTWAFQPATHRAGRHRPAIAALLAALASRPGKSSRSVLRDLRKGE